ncbi:MAG: Peptidase of plants and bacteria [Pedosphaera sp.]|nr:Peptidase of plants and bacteria [Pedosphaera sp.]
MPAKTFRNGALAKLQVCLLLYLGLVGVVLAGPVREVDYSQMPELHELASQMRLFGNEVYPKILALLGDDRSKLPQHFDIVFKQRLNSIGKGWLKNEIAGLAYHRSFCTPQIHLNATWSAQHSETVYFILIHEMTHVAQDYKWYRRYKMPYCWTEGIADYTC